MYYCYVTPWSEGVIVVKDTDTKFAVGCDSGTGSVVYVDTLEEALKECDTVEKYEDIEKVVKLDSALYQRYPIDREEGIRYEELLNIELRPILSKILL